MTNHLQILRDLVALGEKATKGPFNIACNATLGPREYVRETDGDTHFWWGIGAPKAPLVADDGLDNVVCLTTGRNGVLRKADAAFFRDAANARPALKAILARMEALEVFAKAHEKWEANLINHPKAWGADGMDPCPRIVDELYDEFMEVQKLRNAALAKLKETP